MKGRSGLVCMVLGLLLLLAAAGLTGYNMWDENRADESAEKAAVVLRAAIEESKETERPEGVLPAYQVAPQVEMPVVEIDGHYYVGTITIPALELELPVLDEWSYPNLKLAPCRYYGSAYLNNLVLAAHNYKWHFGQLVNLAIGDLVQFTDMDGNVFNYSVADMEQLKPNQTWDMVVTDYDLTLFTCTIGGQQRVTVRCVREE